MMNILRVAPLVVLLVLGGCGDQGQKDASGGTADQSQSTSNSENANRSEQAPSTEPLSIWFEPLLSGGGTPSVSVDFIPTPDGKQLFILGRNGGLHLVNHALEDFPVGPFTRDQVKKSYQKDTITKVQIDGTYAKGDLGAMAIALDPDYEKNGFLYVWYANKGDTATLLDRFKWSPVQAEFEKSRTNIITVSRQDPPAPYHAGGIVKFLPDGTLLLCPGDAERPELSQDPTSLNGKVLRIRPQMDADGGYDVPDDNPRFEGIEHRPEIVGMGLRAVFRGCFDAKNQLIFGDVGSAREEINVYTGGAENFGWGLFDYADGPENMPEGIVKPLVWWDKNDPYTKEDPDYSGETRLSAGVGLVYEKPDAQHDVYQGRLNGHLIFFEIMRGWIRNGPWDAATATLGQHRHLGHLSFISQMRQGRDGYVYVLTWGGNPTLFRVRPMDDIAAH